MMCVGEYNYQLPDGSIVDSEGGVWTAIFGGGKIVRYSQTGK